MKQLMTTATLLLLIVFSFNADAQKLSESDQKDIEKVYADFTAAFEKMDAQATVNFYTGNGIHIDPDGQIVRGRKDLLAFHEKLFAWFKSLARPDKTIHQDTDWNTRYLAPGLIQVTYTSGNVRYFGDKHYKEKFSIAAILKRVGDKWLAEQVAMTPVNDWQNSNR
jgi:uncharacterized protein (TIGR02246 family)